MNKSLKIAILLIISFILLIILIIRLFQEEYTNNIITELFNSVDYIKYDQFVKNYQIVNNFKIPIYIFYHLCPSSYDNKHHITIIDEQINELINSGLYNECDTVYYGCNCKNCDTFLDNHLQQYEKFKKMKLAICPNTNTYENMTINSMIDFAKKSKHIFYGLYLHTKGTSAVSPTQNNWRQFMMYYLVTNYKLCIDVMNRGYYTCGVNYLRGLDLKRHYSGNFFWFNSNYLKKLDKINNIYDRMSAEMILFTKYVKNKHISISNKRYISNNEIIKTGLYYFTNDYKSNIKNIEIAII